MTQTSGIFINTSFIIYQYNCSHKHLWDETHTQSRHTRHWTRIFSFRFNLLKPTGHVMHQQFNIQLLYALPTLYLCVLYLSDNKQRLVPLTA